MEILKSTARTREYMERGEAEGRSLIDAMEQGELEGMQTFDTILEKMIRNGTLNRDEALSYASNQGNLRLKLADFNGAPEASPDVPATPPRTQSGNSMLDMLDR
jgi:twitching motility protein PilT